MDGEEGNEEEQDAGESISSRCRQQSGIESSFSRSCASTIATERPQVWSTIHHKQRRKNLVMTFDIIKHFKCTSLR